MIKITVNPSPGYKASVSVTKSPTINLMSTSVITPNGDVPVTQDGNVFVFAMPNYDIDLKVTFTRISSGSKLPSSSDSSDTTKPDDSDTNKPDINDNIVPENPSTSDNIVIFIIIPLLSIITIGIVYKKFLKI